MCPEFRVDVRVAPKGDISDPQSKAVTDATHRLGFDRVRSVQQGKSFQLSIENAEDSKEARRLAADLAQQLLSNPVIEDYRILFVREVKEKSSTPAENPQGK